MNAFVDLVLLGLLVYGIYYFVYKYPKKRQQEEQSNRVKIAEIERRFEMLMNKETLTATDVAGFEEMIRASGLLPRSGGSKLFGLLDLLELKQQFMLWAEEIEKGNVKPLNNTPVILEAEEKAYYSATCTVYRYAKETVKKENIYLGSRIKIGSVPLYFGGGIPLTETHDTLNDIGSAEFVITDKRIVVSGPKASYVIPLKSIFDLKVVRTIFGFVPQIMYDGINSGNIFRLENPAKCLVIAIWLIESGKEEKTRDNAYVDLPPEKVLEKLKDKIRENPDDAEAYFELGKTNLGMLESKDEKVGTIHAEDAIRAFKEVIKLKPEWAEAYSTLGASYVILMLIKKERSPEIIEEVYKAFQEATRLKPDFVEAHAGLGAVYVEKGEKEKALVEYEYLKTKDPELAKSFLEQINEKFIA